MRKFTKSLASMALALILTLGVGGFTAFASEVGTVSGGGYFGATSEHIFPCSGSGGDRRPPEPQPCVCGGGDGINLSPICGNG
ncbi:MAG: hypothetical protein FWG65_11930 [Turicibacter sp.]|nr:hypothetical protein [Turicibacter sp.]